MSVDIKITHNQATRRFNLPLAFSAEHYPTLRSQIVERFSITTGDANSFGLVFNDKDGDAIVISSSEELQDVWPVATRNFDGIPPLRFAVVQLPPLSFSAPSSDTSTNKTDSTFNEDLQALVKAVRTAVDGSDDVKKALKKLHDRKSDSDGEDFVTLDGEDNLNLDSIIGGVVGGFFARPPPPPHHFPPPPPHGPPPHGRHRRHHGPPGCFMHPHFMPPFFGPPPPPFFFHGEPGSGPFRHPRFGRHRHHLYGPRPPFPPHKFTGEAVNTTTSDTEEDDLEMDFAHWHPFDGAEGPRRGHGKHTRFSGPSTSDFEDRYERRGRHRSHSKSGKHSRHEEY